MLCSNFEIPFLWKINAVDASNLDLFKSLNLVRFYTYIRELLQLSVIEVSFDQFRQKQIKIPENVFLFKRYLFENLPSQSTITFSKSTIETPEQFVKFV